MCNLERPFCTWEGFCVGEEPFSYLKSARSAKIAERPYAPSRERPAWRCCTALSLATQKGILNRKMCKRDASNRTCEVA